MFFVCERIFCIQIKMHLNKYSIELQTIKKGYL